MERRGMQGLPPLNLDHFIRLADDTGILQFAKFGVRDPASGYATDDNARALVVAARLQPSQLRDRLARLYLGFLLFAQDADGSFQHLISYDRSRPGVPASDDCYGRCVWACGEVVASDLAEPMKQTAELVFGRAWPHLDAIAHVRGWANAVQGLAAYHGAKRDTGVLAMLVRLADRMLDALRAHSQGSWTWFEDILTYEPGRLPLALVSAYALTGATRYRDAADLTLQFLESRLHLSEGMPAKCPQAEGLFVPVGNSSWYPRGGPRSFYDQQPVDAGSMVEAYAAAGARYRRLARDAMAWFFGANTAGMPLYDPATGGCYDGLNPEGRNLNLGAEATIAYLLAHLTYSARPAGATRSLSALSPSRAALAAPHGEADPAPQPDAWPHSPPSSASPV